MCFVLISEQTVTFALYIINRLVFITEMDSVYCAVSTESLTNTDTSHPYRVNIQSNLGSRTPRIMNNSVYEQIFRTQSVSVDYCVSSYEYASRQHRGAISWEYQRRQYS